MSVEILLQEDSNGTRNVSQFANESETNINSFYFYETEQFAILWLLLIIIVAGNSGVLLTIICGSVRKSRMNYFIKHLALADLLVGAISVLTDIIWHMTVSWNAGNALCKIIRYSQVVVTYASTYVLVALSIDRYYAIRHPMRFSGSWKRAKCLIVTAWLLSIIFSTPILLLYEEKLIQDKLQCWIEFGQQWHWQFYMTTITLSLFIVPVTIIGVCYGVIIATIWSKRGIAVVRISTKNSLGSVGSNSSKRASSKGVIPRAKVKTVKIALAIVTVFVLCWSPYFVFDLLQVYGYIPQTQSMVAFATLVQSLVHLNSAANPIIYGIFSTRLCSSICSLKIFSSPRRKGPQSQALKTQTNTSTLSDSSNNPRSSSNEVSLNIYTKTVIVHHHK